MQSELKVCDKGTFYRKYKRNVSTCLPHTEVISQSQPVPESLNQISTIHPFFSSLRYRCSLSKCSLANNNPTTIQSDICLQIFSMYPVCLYNLLSFLPAYPPNWLTARFTLTPTPQQRVAHFSQDLRLINLNGNESHSHFRFRAKAIPSKWISHPHCLPRMEYKLSHVSFPARYM